MKMNTYGPERVRLWADTQVVVVTGIYIYIRMDLWTGTPLDELKG